jgi:hypothetical protein
MSLREQTAPKRENPKIFAVAASATTTAHGKLSNARRANGAHLSNKLLLQRSLLFAACSFAETCAMHFSALFAPDTRVSAYSDPTNFSFAHLLTSCERNWCELRCYTSLFISHCFSEQVKSFFLQLKNLHALHLFHIVSVLSLSSQNSKMPF